MALSAQDKRDIVDATIQGVMQQLRRVIRDSLAETRGSNPTTTDLTSDETPATHSSDPGSAAGGTNSQPQSGNLLSGRYN